MAKRVSSQQIALMTTFLCCLLTHPPGPHSPFKYQEVCIMIPFMEEILPREGLGYQITPPGRIAGLVMPGAEVCWESHPPTHQEMKSKNLSLNLPVSTHLNMNLGLGHVGMYTCVCISSSCKPRGHIAFQLRAATAATAPAPSPLPTRAPSWGQGRCSAVQVTGQRAAHPRSPARLPGCGCHVPSRPLSPRESTR